MGQIVSDVYSVRNRNNIVPRVLAVGVRERVWWAQHTQGRVVRFTSLNTHLIVGIVRIFNKTLYRE
jgi:hypothetical protein